MWSELTADARLYSRLKWAGRDLALWRALIWFCSAGLLALAMQRISHRYLQCRATGGWTTESILLRVVIALARLPVMILTKSDVAGHADIGHRVYLSDGGFLILGPERIGSGTVIHERVSIGVRAGDAVKPVIGENVWIGPDSVIYGDLRIGDGATVLPGSVVSMSIPAGAVAAGNPAIIVRRQFDNAVLRSSPVRQIDPKAFTSG